MNNDPTSVKKYPLLCEILAVHQRNLRATYTVADVAALFNVSARAIQNRVASGQLPARDLPGRARFLSEDLEAFLIASRKKVQRRAA